MGQEIVIIATGGTIAGRGSSEQDMTGYQAGSYSLDELLADMPALQAYGPLRGVQLCSIDSSDMQVGIWLDLVRAIEREAAKDDVAGIVVLHGTDTMEEGAFFIHLAAKTEKPIVITGAMRPPTALSADGPLNLLHAIQVARSEATACLGAVVVMNGRIHGARDVLKQHTLNSDAFGNSDAGILGLVQDGEVYLYHNPSQLHTIDTPFEVGQRTSLPKVELLTLYGAMDGAVVDGYAAMDMEGLVIAGLGHGMIPQHVREKLRVFLDKDVVCLKASRAGHGAVTATPDDGELGLIPAGTLPPSKARILLMWLLTVTQDRAQIANYWPYF